MLIARYREPGAVGRALDEVRGSWDRLLSTVQVKTPDAAMDLLLNRWLLTQVLACRVWARSAFYQSGGAYGFRDQLQDVMALTLAAPAEARAQILRAASRQFTEGDAQHWWHPPDGRGVRTRISDDPLWLAFVASHYADGHGRPGDLRRGRALPEGPRAQARAGRGLRPPAARRGIGHDRRPLRPGHRPRPPVSAPTACH